MFGNEQKKGNQLDVAIIGIGLIGGSLSLALKQKGLAKNIIGVDKNPEHQKKALDLGLVCEIADLEEAVSRSDLVILCTPVDHIISQINTVLDLVDGQVVMDVGSTKTLIMKIADLHPKRRRFVGTHPMAGTEYSGPHAAIPDLFESKCTVLCDVGKSDPDALELVETIYRKMGMNIVYHESVDHDIHTAYVSHISHISSIALALTVLEKERNEKRIFELAGGGFSSTVRLANSNPDTWIPIFEQNRDNVLDVLDEHINTISRFRTLLIKRDFTTFYQLIQQANKIKKIIN